MAVRARKKNKKNNKSPWSPSNHLFIVAPERPRTWFVVLCYFDSMQSRSVWLFAGTSNRLWEDQRGQFLVSTPTDLRLKQTHILRWLQMRNIYCSSGRAYSSFSWKSQLLIADVICFLWDRTPKSNVLSVANINQCHVWNEKGQFILRLINLSGLSV